MSIEYKLGKTNSEKYQQLGCEKGSEAIVKEMSMFGFGDCISFSRKGTNAIFGTAWGLGNLGCFRELRPYIRLVDMPRQDVERLAARMHEVLYMGIKGRRYNVEPQVDEAKPEHQQILEELITLQETQRRLIASREIVFPQISYDELAFEDLW